MTRLTLIAAGVIAAVVIGTGVGDVGAIEIGIGAGIATAIWRLVRTGR